MPFEIYSQWVFNNAQTERGLEVCITGQEFGTGIAIEDIDNDGDLDLFVPTQLGGKDLIYLNDGTGNFVESSDNLGIASLGRSIAGIWFDYNADRLPDLLTIGYCGVQEENCFNTRAIQLFQQTLEGSFRDVTMESNLESFGEDFTATIPGGVAVGDLNLDGFLDIVHTLWGTGGVSIYINDGNGKFLDNSNSSRIGLYNRRFWQPLIYDFDQDGDMDVYLNVDMDMNQLWLNQGNIIFREQANLFNVNTARNEMGISIGDFQNDGLLDLYITNIEDDQQSTYNVLYKGYLVDGIIQYQDVAAELNVQRGGWGWGTSFFDANNDGWLDLIATNGFSTYPIDQTKFWLNNGDGSFINMGPELSLNDEYSGSCILAFDYDRDGDLDIVQSIRTENISDHCIQLLENNLTDVTNSSNYLVIKPRMNGNNYLAIGAIVKARVQGITMQRVMTAGTSFYGQEPSEAFFGIGGAEFVDEIEVIWPGGAVTKISNISVNQVLTVTDDDVIHTPTEFSAKLVEQEIELRWNDYSSNEDAYILERSLNSNFESAISFVLPSNVTQYIDSDIQPNLIYYYRLRANLDNNYSEYSKIVEVISYYESPLGSDNTNEIQFYPNPVSAEGKIQIHSQADIKSVEIVGINGVIADDWKIHYDHFNNSIQISPSKGSKGLYFIRVGEEALRILVK